MAKKKTAKRKTTRKGTRKERAPARQCAMMQHHKYLAETDETYQRNRRDIERFSARARLEAAPERTTVLRIPVVVHVLYHTDEENLPLEQITAQIDALNRDYRLRNEDRDRIPNQFREFAADSLLEFDLAVRDPQGNSSTGITRTRTAITQFPYDRFDRAAIAKLNKLIKHDEFGKAAWPRDDYLNMWVCNIEGGLLGYAAFPGEAAPTDGVVINDTAFGSGGIAQAPFNLGRTATHEVGHWLNLLHIWGDDGGGCFGSDNVADTPNQAGPNSGPNTTFPHVTCNNAPNGDMFMNYMDYVDDEAMVMFTRGQVARINDTLDGPRAPLKDSLGLTPVVTERIALEAPARRSLAVAVGCEAETGSQAKTVFDGVSWIPIDEADID